MAKSTFLQRSKQIESENEAEDAENVVEAAQDNVDLEFAQSMIAAQRLGGQQDATVQNNRVEEVRDALRHLWSGYKEVAWGADEVEPISGRQKREVWGAVGMQILDTLDTLWLAGLHKEFAEGEKWVSNLQLEPLGHEVRTSFFEITIRGLAGLLSAYALSGHQVLLDKAKLLGDRLLKAFPQPGERQGHVWPVEYMDVHNPDDQEVTPSFRDTSALADVGSNVLEFDYLSQATGDPSYKLAADGVMNKLVAVSDSMQEPLLPLEIDPYAADDFKTPQVSVGAMGDSYYEYLLKNYIQSGFQKQNLLSTWKAAMREMKDHLLFESPQGFTYIATKAARDGPGTYHIVDPGMEHLSCYVGGMLAMASYFVPANEAEDWWLPTAIEITKTCYEMYRISPTGLAPDTVYFDEQGMQAADRNYRLRPETLEALFYLHRITGDATYQEWSWKIFQAIKDTTKTQYGFATVNDVMESHPMLVDSEETFMGAETLKYALLTQMPAKTISLDKFVLNTEAHPFPVAQQA